MRILLFTLLLCILLLGGCGKPGAATSPQQAQLDAFRQGAISKLETMSHRPLTDAEKSCVTTKLDDGGGITLFIMSPLADEVKDWKQRNVTTQP